MGKKAPEQLGLEVGATQAQINEALDKVLHNKWRNRSKERGKGKQQSSCLEGKAHHGVH
jgi:hypothetical protein